ncbi:saccharopine dehydrogenase, partial [Bacillus cereus]
FGIATELIAKGNVNKVGVVTPEEAFVKPQIIFDELKKRGIHIHEEVFVEKESYNFV